MSAWNDEAQGSPQSHIHQCNQGMSLKCQRGMIGPRAHSRAHPKVTSSRAIKRGGMTLKCRPGQTADALTLQRCQGMLANT
eukprot:7907025-Karenia_brevis.AAC.1